MSDDKPLTLVPEELSDTAFGIYENAVGIEELLLVIGERRYLESTRSREGFDDSLAEAVERTRILLRSLVKLRDRAKELR